MSELDVFKKKKARGDRGKWAEGEGRKVFMEMEQKRAGFTFNRIPDAHGGSMQPATADFQWFYKEDLHFEHPDKVHSVPYTRNGLVEFKQTEHEYRLNHSNFSADKVARMKVREMAGSETLILIAHKPEGVRGPNVLWRAAPLGFFLGERVKGIGSWDLRQLPFVDFKKVLWGIVT